MDDIAHETNFTPIYTQYSGFLPDTHDQDMQFAYYM